VPNVSIVRPDLFGGTNKQERVLVILFVRVLILIGGTVDLNRQLVPLGSD
jgi:hypothetical protein